MSVDSTVFATPQINHGIREWNRRERGGLERQIVDVVPVEELDRALRHLVQSGVESRVPGPNVERRNDKSDLCVKRGDLLFRQPMAVRGEPSPTVGSREFGHLIRRQRVESRMRCSHPPSMMKS